jgi:ribosome maturation factor RimP
MIETIKAATSVRPADHGQNPIDRINAVVKPILWSLGLELVEISLAGQGTRTIVKVFIDKAGGVTLDDCERAHRAINPALDVADPFPHAYTLEISSPGLDRPLRHADDYRRLQGNRVSLKLKEPYHGQWRIAGIVTSVEDDAILLAESDKRVDEVIRIELGRIASGKQEVGFERPPRQPAEPGHGSRAGERGSL